MRRTVITLLLALGVIWLDLPGCSRDTGPGASTPEALISRFSRGMKALDSDEVAACFHDQDKAAGAVLALLEDGLSVIRKQRELDRAVRQRFGNRFADEKMAMQGADPTVLLARLDKLAEGTEVIVQGDQAEVKLRDAPSGTAPARLRKKDGRWYFSVAPYFPDDPNLCAHLRNIFKAFRDCYDQSLKALDQTPDPDAFVESVNQAYQKLSQACGESIQTVMPFVERYR